MHRLASPIAKYLNAYGTVPIVAPIGTAPMDANGRRRVWK